MRVEFGPGPHRTRYTENLQGNFTETEKAVQEYGRAEQRFHRLRVSEQTESAAGDVTERYGAVVRHETDGDWLEAAQDVPGMTPHLINELFAAKRGIEIRNAQQDQRDVASEPTGLPAATEQVAGYYTETETRFLYHLAELGENIDTIRDEEETMSDNLHNAVVRGIEHRGSVAEAGTDQLWTRAMFNHPDVSPHTAQEIVTAKEELREGYDAYFQEKK